MYYLSLQAGAGDPPMPLITMARELKHLKPLYRLVDIRWISGVDGPDDLAPLLARALMDRGLTGRKRVFSQDRRPSKQVRVPPTLLLGVSGAGGPWPDRLRESGVPVEGIHIEERREWRRRDYRTICLGNDYDVPPALLSEALARAVERDRLHADDGAPASALADVRGAVDPPATDPAARRLATAVALPLWFGEATRRIKRYGEA